MQSRHHVTYVTASPRVALDAWKRGESRRHLLRERRDTRGRASGRRGTRGRASGRRGTRGRASGRRGTRGSTSRCQRRRRRTRGDMNRGRLARGAANRRRDNTSVSPLRRDTLGRGPHRLRDHTAGRVSCTGIARDRSGLARIGPTARGRDDNSERLSPGGSGVAGRGSRRLARRRLLTTSS